MRASTRWLRVRLPLVLLTPLACAQPEPRTRSAADMGPPAATTVRTGAAAFGDWRGDAPGVRYHIRPADLPTAVMTGTDPEASVANPAEVVARPTGATLKVPDGFEVSVFASGFNQPRRLRIAPNGDIFLSESGTGRVLVFQAGGAGGASATPHVFAENLDRPYGIAFLPPADPQYVYVAAANQVVRYPYRTGDLEAGGPAEVIVADIPTERHWTRDLAVSRDGQRLFLAVGSASNLGVNGMPELTPAQIRQFEETHGRGAAWGEEENRATVRMFDPEALPKAVVELDGVAEAVNDPYAAAENADALVICTEWDEFKSPDFERLRSLLRRPIIFDGRNLYRPASMRRLGFEHHSIGRPSVQLDESSELDVVVQPLMQAVRKVT